MLLHAFIDESEYRDKYFILSALIVEDDKLKQLNSDLKALLSDYCRGDTNVAPTYELHGYDLLQQKGDWKNIRMNIAASIYKRALGVINQHGAAIYFETIDREAQRQRYQRVYNHRSMAIGYILERVNEYAEEHGNIANAYLDDHYTAPEGRKEFIESVRLFVCGGGAWFTSSPRIGRGKPRLVG